jgi:hypothetical protein
MATSGGSILFAWCGPLKHMECAAYQRCLVISTFREVNILYPEHSAALRHKRNLEHFTQG